MARTRLGSKTCPKLSFEARELSAAERFEWEAFGTLQHAPSSSRASTHHAAPSMQSFKPEHIDIIQSEPWASRHLGEFGALLFDVVRTGLGGTRDTVTHPKRGAD